MSWIEFAASVFGILYVALMIRENILCWVAGNISVVLIAVSCYNTQLYADMALQVIYFGAGVYGFVSWYAHPSARSTSVEIHRTRARQWTFLCLLFLVIWGATYYTLTHVRDAALIEADSVLFSASLVATFMQARKYFENWMLWIPVNFAYSCVYYQRALYPYILLSVIFATMSVVGWRSWSKKLPVAGRS